MDVLVKSVECIEAINMAEPELKIQFDRDMTSDQLIDLLKVLCDKEEAYYRENRRRPWCPRRGRGSCTPSIPR